MRHRPIPIAMLLAALLHATPPAFPQSASAPPKVGSSAAPATATDTGHATTVPATPAPATPVPATTAPAIGDVAVPLGCFVHKAPRGDRKRPIDRIELQILQIRSKDGTPLGPLRVQLGIQPRGGDDVIPSEISAPCDGAGETLSCKIVCGEGSAVRQHGRFRITPAARKGLLLTIETPLSLNVCDTSETPFKVPAAIVGKATALARTNASQCFH